MDNVLQNQITGYNTTSSYNITRNNINVDIIDGIDDKIDSKLKQQRIASETVMKEYTDTRFKNIDDKLDSVVMPTIITSKMFIQILVQLLLCPLGRFLNCIFHWYNLQIVCITHNYEIKIKYAAIILPVDGDSDWLLYRDKYLSDFKKIKRDEGITKKDIIKASIIYNSTCF